MTDVLIRSKATGEEFAIDAKDFEHGDLAVQKDGTLGSYKDAGYVIVHEHPSGLPYKAPAAHHAAPAKAEEGK